MNRLDRYYDHNGRGPLLMLPPPPLTEGSNSSRNSTWTYKSGGAFSVLERGDRIKPEKMNRRHVQKLQWRHSGWIKGFKSGMDPGSEYDYNELDSRISSMTIADVSPRFAVKRIILLYENFQYREAANFINRLSHGTFKVILNDLPIDLFIDSMPHSLTILEALYAKVFLSDGLNFSMKLLRPEGVVMQMVKFFANQEEITLAGGKDVKWEFCGPFICSCKKLLKVIVLSDPKVKKILQQRRRCLDKAIEGMGQHGLVGTTDETLMNLHDALKVEFQKVVETYKEALQKLEELALANKTSVTRSVSHGPAPIQASHQRQLSLKQTEIQERLIKNKTVLNVVEPTLGNHSLDILLGILQRRIEHDKEVLFQFTELKKEVRSIDPSSVVAPVLMRYSHGCEQVLELMREVAEDEADSSDISGYHSDSDSAIMMSGNSPYVSKRARYQFLTRSVRSGSKSSVRTSVLLTGCGPSSGSASGRESGSGSESPIGGPTRPRHIKLKKELQKLNSAGSSSSASSEEPAPICVNCRVRTNLQISTPAVDPEVSKLRAELHRTRAILQSSQEKERRLQERLADQAARTIERTPNGRFENIGLGECRPTSLVRKYGSLYAQARVDALDALDYLPELRDAEELKSKILFSVVVLSFRAVQGTVQTKRDHIRRILQMPPPTPIPAPPPPPPTPTQFPQSQGTMQQQDQQPQQQQQQQQQQYQQRQPSIVSASTKSGDKAAEELEHHIALYLRRTIDRFDLTKSVDEVLSQIWATLYDYPSLKECEGLIQYVKDAVRLAWGLTNQSPPYVLEFEIRSFRKDMHVRFHSSDPETEDVKTYLWPALLEGPSGPCVHKGVVIT